MTQNIYDNPEFFSAYGRLERSIEGLAGASEWPALRALLPDLRGRRVLDLGCGYGWFCRFARESGAAEVLGLDVSERMLERARATTDDPRITYRRADLEELTLSPASYDLVFSSLTFHYIVQLERLWSEIHGALVPGGSFVFSVEHPLFTASPELGWLDMADGRKAWPVRGYLDEGPRATDWLAKGVIKRHRTIGTYVNLLVKLGFTLTHIDEWGPTEAQVAARPDWLDERQRPPFLLIAARRP